MNETQHLEEPISGYARRDFAVLRERFTVAEALDTLRGQELGERIVYFYVVDDRERLVGVLPVRRLLMAKPDRLLGDIIIRQVVTLPETATVLEACELFALHRFLALPVVNREHQLVGVVEVTLFTEEIFDFSERERLNEVFEAVGFRVSAVREARPWVAFRHRFPWLMATVVSGTLCAMLAGAFEATLAKSLVLAFFLTLVLGLGESVSVQSLTVTIRALQVRRPTWKWFGQSLAREIPTAVMLGTGCGLAVAAVVWAWRGPGPAVWVVGGSILAAMVTACLWGLGVPTLLHALRLDPRIAAGPVTLAVTDLTTLLIYFSTAAWIL